MDLVQQRERRRPAAAPVAPGLQDVLNDVEQSQVPDLKEVLPAARPPIGAHDGVDDPTRK